MRTRLIAFGAGAALLLTFGAAFAHDRASARADWIGERLELTEEQQARVDAILESAREQRKALKAQAREMRKAAAEQRKSLREQSNAIGQSMQEQLAAVLTEEQNAKLVEMRDRLNRRAIMRGDRHGGGMRGPRAQRRKEAVRLMHRRAERAEAEAKQQAQAPASEE